MPSAARPGARCRFAAGPTARRAGPVALGLSASAAWPPRPARHAQGMRAPRSPRKARAPRRSSVWPSGPSRRDMDHCDRRSPRPYGRARVGRTARAGARPDSEQLRFQSGHHMRRMLTWASSLDRAALAADGHRLVEFTAVRREVESRTRRAQQRRTSLANPAEEWLSGVAAAGKLAILGVRLTSLDDLRVLHGYVLEPALRYATAVAVEFEQRLTRLPPVQFVDPEFGYPYTLERALDAAMRLFQDRCERLPEPRAVEAAAAADESALDAWQRSAVAAREGVVQVIAPAGRGKTAVLIERVRELVGRGVPEERILCTTFNRDARVELQDRLAAAGVGSVPARTFHSIGWWLLREERLARRGGPRELSFNQWSACVRSRCATRANGSTPATRAPRSARSSWVSWPRPRSSATAPTAAGMAQRWLASTSSTNATSSSSRFMTSTTSCCWPSGRCAATRSCGAVGSPALTGCWFMSTRTSSPPRSCSCVCSPRRRTACSASATRTRPCTDGDAPASDGWLTSISPIQGCSATRSRTTTAARGGSSPRRGG